MPIAAIALGSNLPSPFGDREANLREAIRRLAPLGTVTAVSSFHDTAPVGTVPQARFLNAAVLIETQLTPHALMSALLAIEHAMGRDRTAVQPKGPRLIDLDLLLLGPTLIDSPHLTLPHPALAERRFVLEPLAEIAPHLLDPRTGLTISALLSRLAPL